MKISSFTKVIILVMWPICTKFNNNLGSPFFLGRYTLTLFNNLVKFILIFNFLLYIFRKNQSMFLLLISRAWECFQKLSILFDLMSDVGKIPLLVQLRKISLYILFFLSEINFNRFLMFSAGILLFLVSPSLCEKVVFHYTTGTLIGVLGSVLIVVYLTSRLVPKVFYI